MHRSSKDYRGIEEGVIVSTLPLSRKGQSKREPNNETPDRSAVIGVTGIYELSSTTESRKDGFSILSLSFYHPEILESACTSATGANINDPLHLHFTSRIDRL
jgi:hypothetical protein